MPNFYDALVTVLKCSTVPRYISQNNLARCPCAKILWPVESLIYFLKKSDIILWLFGVANFGFKFPDACFFLGEIKPAELEVRFVDEPGNDNLGSSVKNGEFPLLSTNDSESSLSCVTRGESVSVPGILSPSVETVWKKPSPSSSTIFLSETELSFNGCPCAVCTLEQNLSRPELEILFFQL